MRDKTSKSRRLPRSLYFRQIRNQNKTQVDPSAVFSVIEITENANQKNRL